jgi:hypothetical protein
MPMWHDTTVPLPRKALTAGRPTLRLSVLFLLSEGLAFGPSCWVRSP